MQSDHPSSRHTAALNGQACRTVPPARGFITFALFGTGIWAVWNESLSPIILVQGACLSCLSLLITNHFLLKSPYPELYWLHPFTLVRFAAVLLVAIFQSGIHAIYVTLTGRMDVRVIDLPTNVSTPFHGVLIANAITLTPGTVTIEHSHGNFKVIWIECLTTDPEEASELIKGRFERVFGHRMKGLG